MKIGISSGNFGVHSDSMDPAALGKKAEDLGFESFFMPEHTIFPVDCVSPYVGTLDGSRPDYLSHQADPLITLARVSAATQKLKLGTAVLLVPEHEPMLLAKQIATLDYWSGEDSSSASAPGGIGKRARSWAGTSNIAGPRCETLSWR